MDWLKGRDPEKPFLLCLQFKAPHHDYGHAARYDEVLAGVPVPEPPTLYEDVRNCDSPMKKLFIETTRFLRHPQRSPHLREGGERGCRVVRPGE